MWELIATIVGAVIGYRILILVLAYIKAFFGNLMDKDTINGNIDKLNKGASEMGHNTAEYLKKRKDEKRRRQEEKNRPMCEIH